MRKVTLSQQQDLRWLYYRQPDGRQLTGGRGPIRWPLTLRCTWKIQIPSDAKQNNPDLDSSSRVQ
jgi:hypothetical protein